MSPKENKTQGLKVSFGKYSGTLYTRVPRGYLIWMVNACTQEWEIAQAELERRGTALPEVELSGHAIDKASLRVRHIWHRSRRHDEEGLYSWLQRITLEARENGERLENGKIRYLKMLLVIAEGEEFPVLQTIMAE